MEQPQGVDRGKALQEISNRMLYPEAEQFMRRLIEEGHEPIPASQVSGLLNVARMNTYTQLRDFVTHQRERDWPQKSLHIKAFYQALERYLQEMYQRRVRGEFHLVDERTSGQAFRAQVEEAMTLLAFEFIQHLLAENNRLRETGPRSAQDNKRRRA